MRQCCRALVVAAMVVGFSGFGAGACAETSVAGLHGRVEILRDRWGIAHIRAEDEHDLFFAQGYNVARDRLFQLELWRREATGTLAEIQGARAVPRDISARLFRFRGDLARDLGCYHPRGASIAGAFVEGINAYIDSTEKSPDSLPLEFRVLGIRPGRWTMANVVSRHNGLYRNVSQEVQTAQLVHMLGADRTRALLNLHPGRPPLIPDKAVDLASVDEKVIASYRASRSTLRFEPADVVAKYRDRANRALLSDPPIDGGFLMPEQQGSNNWVISGERTFTRAPLMANDPHRSIQIPSLRYWVHLVAPGWNVIGAGEPALPGVAVGHNERGAWGFTIFPVDQEDLYVYETDPSDGARYKYLGGWETMRAIDEQITVKGQGPVTATLKYTRHGPIVYEDREHHRAYAVRAGWLEEGAAPYLASLRLDQAQNWGEFREAAEHFLTPSENLVWADVDGHVGWQAVGLTPKRKNWDGLLPVPGDGRYEWDGFVPIRDLPHLLDPAGGWFASANQDNLPPGYKHAVGFQWSDPFRFSRVEEVLGAGRRFTLTDMVRLQQDELSVPARSLVPLLDGIAVESRRLAPAIERLNLNQASADSDPQGFRGGTY